MPRLFAFECFDPKTGVPPDEFFGKFKGIAQRSRAILNKRTSEEIVAISDVISWLLSHETVISAIAESIGKDLECNSQDELYYDGMMDEPKMLLFCKDNVSLDFSNGIESLAWAEIFAVHALALIADVCARMEKEPGFSRPAFGESLPVFVGADAIDAMECICTAESLVEQGRVQSKVREKISLQKQKAAFKRHSAVNDLKREFIHFYVGGDFHSRADAARRFYSSLAEDRKKLLKPSNAVRTLTEALRDYLKDES